MTEPSGRRSIAPGAPVPSDPVPVVETTPQVPVSDGSAPDTRTYAFTDSAPWQVVDHELRWRVGLDGVRRRTRAQVRAS